MKLIGPLYNTSSLCMPILRALPDWFGIEEALLQYEGEIDRLPTFLVHLRDEPVGFLSVKQHYPQSAELYVMGVRPEAQGKGLGKALVRAAEGNLRREGVLYLQVKTLGPSNSDPNYARTRDFYEAVGFTPLEEFKQIWDEHNPCLVMVKRL